MNLINVPYRRLTRPIHNGNSRSTRPPTNRLLTEEEKGLVIWLKQLDSLGTRANKDMLKRQSNCILFQNHTSPSTEAPQCGEKWATRFLERHPELGLRKDSGCGRY